MQTISVKKNVWRPFWAEPCYVENCRESPLFKRSLNIVTFRLVVKTSQQELTFCSIFEPLCFGNQIFGIEQRLISLKKQCLTSKQEVVWFFINPNNSLLH